MRRLSGSTRPCATRWSATPIGPWQLPCSRRWWRTLATFHGHQSCAKATTLGVTRALPWMDCLVDRRGSRCGAISWPPSPSPSLTRRCSKGRAPRSSVSARFRGMDHRVQPELVSRWIEVRPAAHATRLRSRPLRQYGLAPPRYCPKKHVLGYILCPAAEDSARGPATAWEALLRVASVYEDASLGTMLLPSGTDTAQPPHKPPSVAASAATAHTRRRASGPATGGRSPAHKARRTPSRPEASTAAERPASTLPHPEATEDSGTTSSGDGNGEDASPAWTRLPARKDVHGWLAHRHSCLTSSLNGSTPDAGAAVRLRDTSARATSTALHALGPPGGETPVLSYRWREGEDVAASCRALYTLAEGLCAVLSAYVSGGPAPGHDTGAAPTVSRPPGAGPPPGADAAAARGGPAPQHASPRSPAPPAPPSGQERPWGPANGVSHPGLARAMASRCAAAHSRIALARANRSGGGPGGGSTGAPVLREVQEEGAGEDPPSWDSAQTARTEERRVVVFVVPPRYLLRAGVARERERDAFFAALAPLVALASPVAAVRLVPNRFVQYRPLSAPEVLAQAMKTYDRLGTGAFSHAAFADGAVEYRPRCLCLPAPALLPHRTRDMVASLSMGSIGPPWSVTAPVGDRGASDDDASETEDSGLDSGPDTDAAVAPTDVPHLAHDQDGDAMGRQGAQRRAPSRGGVSRHPAHAAPPLRRVHHRGCGPQRPRGHGAHPVSRRHALAYPTEHRRTAGRGVGANAAADQPHCANSAWRPHPLCPGAGRPQPCC